MRTADLVDKQISDYLGQLNLVQKKAILNIIKAFTVEDTADDNFDEEMNRRIAEYESGSVKTYTWEESIAHAREVYKTSKSTK